MGSVTMDVRLGQPVTLARSQAEHQSTLNRIADHGAVKHGATTESNQCEAR